MSELWTSEDVKKKARAMRHANAAKGLRAPVQVMEGNYQVMTGVCPWWDSVKAASVSAKVTLDACSVIVTSVNDDYGAPTDKR